MESRDAHRLGAAPTRPDVASTAHELRRVERALAELAARPGDATVGEIAAELTRLSRSGADARGALEAAAGPGRRRRHGGPAEHVGDVPSADDESLAAAVLQRDADARLALVREWGAWSATELADRAGASASNRSALASAWRTSGR